MEIESSSGAKHAINQTFFRAFVHFLYVLLLVHTGRCWFKLTFYVFCLVIFLCFKSKFMCYACLYFYLVFAF